MKKFGLFAFILMLSVGAKANKDQVDYSIPFDQWASDLAIICSNYDFSQFGKYDLYFVENRQDLFYVTTRPNYTARDWKPKVLAVFQTDGDHCAKYDVSEAASFIEGFPQELPIGLPFPHANRELFKCRTEMLELKARGYSIGRPQAQLNDGKTFGVHIYRFPIFDYYNEELSYTVKSFSKVDPMRNLGEDFEHVLCKFQ